MKEYIEREAFERHLMFNTVAEDICNDCLQNMIDEMNAFPAADVVERVRGEWVERAVKLDWSDDDVEIHYECSICYELSCGASPFCPNCGADMREVEA